MKIECGDEVKDKVTGFSGIVTSITHYLNGCTRVGVQAKCKGNEIKEPSAFDEPQLTIVKKRVVTGMGNDTGGPRHDIKPKVLPSR